MGRGLGNSGVSRTITSWTTLIHLAEDGGRLEASFCLCVDRFLDHFVLAVELPSAFIHLDFYRRLESLKKESDESGLFTKESRNEGCMIRPGGSHGIKVVLALQRSLLRTFLVAFFVTLSLEEQIDVKLCDPLEVLLCILEGARGGGASEAWGRDTGITGCWSSCFT